MRPLVAFAVGVLFAVGLGISGMTHPTKVLAFLDLMGDWDPSLAFVMGGGVLVNFIVFRLALRRGALGGSLAGAAAESKEGEEPAGIVAGVDTL